MPCPIEPALLPGDPGGNTTKIEAIVNPSDPKVEPGHARIPKGVWPVGAIVMASNSRISGCGMGLSELVLELVDPMTSSLQAVISTAVPEPPIGGEPTYTGPVTVNDITLNGNHQDINWSNITNDGDAFGVWARACQDSMFYNLEIKDCWTDGIMSTKEQFNNTGQDNNSRNCVFDNIIIKDCGRQGVSVVGGEKLVFSNFIVERIGRVDTSDAGFAKSPKAAMDIEGNDPNSVSPPIKNTTRHIAITNWTITDCGQGILGSGDKSFLPAEGLVISNIDCRDLDGVQILRVVSFSGVAVSNLTCRNFNPVDTTANVPDGNAFIIQNAKGTFSNISVFNATNANYMFQIRGDDSDVDLSNILIDGCSGPVVNVGPPTGAGTDAASASISSFVFRNVYLHVPVTKPQIFLGGTIQVQATGNVRFRNGIVRDSDAEDFGSKDIRLFEDAYFEGCDFEQDDFNLLFDQSKDGKAVGITNSWNRLIEGKSADFSLFYESNVNLIANNKTVNLKEQANWSGNEIIVRNQGVSVTATTIKKPDGTPLATVSGEDAAVIVRSNGSEFFANSLG